MAIPGQYNTRIDIRNDYNFDWKFKNDDGTPLPVTYWSFEFTLKDSVGNLIWDVINADFGRPAINEITFSKTVAAMVGLLGVYSIELLVTKPGVVNDTYVYGLYEFVNV